MVWLYKNHFSNYCRTVFHSYLYCTMSSCGDQKNTNYVETGHGLFIINIANNKKKNHNDRDAAMLRLYNKFLTFFDLYYMISIASP